MLSPILESFLGYVSSNKAYRVYNKRTMVVEESMHVNFDETNISSSSKVQHKGDDDEDDDLLGKKLDELQIDDPKDNALVENHITQEENIEPS